jgi:hypothetical protein
MTEEIPTTRAETMVKLSFLVNRQMADMINYIDRFRGDGSPDGGPGTSSTARWLLDLGLRIFSFHQGCECEEKLLVPLSNDDTELVIRLPLQKVAQLRQLASDLQCGLSTFGDVNGVIKVTVLEAALVAIDNGLKAIDEWNKAKAEVQAQRSAPPPTQSPDN